MSYENYFINKNISHWFSIGVLIIFLCILYWLTYDKYKDYLIYNEKVSITAVENAKDAISISIKNNKRLLNNFVRENKNKIIFLINNPESISIYDDLYTRLKRQLPGLFTINLYTKNDGVIIDDFDGFVGAQCETDLKNYFIDNEHKKRTHPNSILYHYDEFSELTYNDTKYLFFASFSLNEITNTLNYSTPRNHNLIIINKYENNLIEITKAGGRNRQKFRNDFTLTQPELKSIIGHTDIPKTYWSVIDVEVSHVNKEFLNSLLTSSGIIFILFLIVILFMQSIISKSFMYLNLSNENLVAKNNEITNLNSELEELAIKDSLTELYNRRYFDKELSKEWSRAVRDQNIISIMIIDIDYFKMFNDLYGHVEGDTCLQMVAKVINSCLSRNNEFVARFGGEEFVAVINDNTESVLKISNLIHEKLSSIKIKHDKSVFKIVSVSIGIASIIPNNETEPTLLIENADIALYSAKENGRSQTQVYKEKSVN